MANPCTNQQIISSRRRERGFKSVTGARILKAEVANLKLVATRKATRVVMRQKAEGPTLTALINEQQHRKMNCVFSDLPVE